MRPDEFLQILRDVPFRPVRIHLTDGTTYEVRHPDQVLVHRARIDISYVKSGTAIVDFVSLLHVIRVEPLPATPDAPAQSN